MRNGKLTVGLILLIFVLLMVLVPVVIVQLNQPVVPIVTLPTPNAFTTLTHAGECVTDIPANYNETTDPEVLRTFVESNRTPLQMIDDAMGQDSVVPIDYNANSVTQVRAVSRSRPAMRLLHAEARLAELEGDSARMAILYAKMFALSNKAANGGLMVHKQVSLAYERLALKELSPLVPELTSERKNEIRTLLAAVNRQPDDVAAIQRREQILFMKEHGTLFGMYAIYMTKGITAPAIQQMEASDAEVAARYHQILESIRE